MDLLKWIYDTVANVIYGINQNITIFVIRMGILLLLTLGLLFFTWFKLRVRNTFLQLLAVFFSIIVSFNMKIEVIRENKSIYVILTIIGLLSIGFLPAVLPFYIAPRLGTQQLMRKILYYSILGLFVIQILIQMFI